MIALAGTREAWVTQPDSRRGSRVARQHGKARTSHMAFPSDLTIARGADLKPLDDVAAAMDIPSHLLHSWPAGRRRSTSWSPP